MREFVDKHHKTVEEFLKIQESLETDDAKLLIIK